VAGGPAELGRVFVCLNVPGSCVRRSRGPWVACVLVFSGVSGSQFRGLRRGPVFSWVSIVFGLFCWASGLALVAGPLCARFGSGCLVAGSCVCVLAHCCCVPVSWFLVDRGLGRRRSWVRLCRGLSMALLVLNAECCAPFPCAGLRRFRPVVRASYARCVLPSSGITELLVASPPRGINRYADKFY